MENKFFIDLSIKYGLDSADLSKLADMIYQSGYSSLDSPEAQKAAVFIIENGILKKPPEEVIEELKREGLYLE